MLSGKDKDYGYVKSRYLPGIQILLLSTLCINAGSFELC